MGSSPCAQCKARLGRTCCELPKSETPTFGLTLPEAARILKATGKPVSECFSIDYLTVEEYNEFVSKSAVFESLFAGSMRLRLNVVPDAQDPETAHCVFLKKGEGCSLPVSVRPNTCRIYPFWFETRLVKGATKFELTIVNNLFPGPCFGKMLTKSDNEELLSLFNMDIESVTKVAKKLLLDAEAHSKAVLSRLRQ